MNNCNIWITVDHDNPDFEDLAKIRRELNNLGIDDKGKIGIGFTSIQWCNFLQNLSRFEHRMTLQWPREVMGFPVRLIEPRRSQEQ